MNAEPIPCPHVPKDERVGDEARWCVVCLRNEVKHLSLIHI